MPLETLLALNYNTFILTVGIKLLVLTLMLETCMVTVIVNYWKYHPRINYYNIFQSLNTCRNEDIYELKGVHTCVYCQL